VYVKDPEKSTYEYREVLLGPRAGDYYIVESGVREGELVVSSGAFKIDADLQIKGQKSMMSNPIGDKGGEKGDERLSRNAGVPSLEKGSVSLLPENLHTVVEGYLDLSEALAADDLAAAIEGIAQLQEWLQQAGLSVSVSGDLLEQKSLSGARMVFEELTDTIVPLLSEYRFPETFTAYRAYCPMARKGKGGVWLQRSKKIRNPYFGASMLGCGKLKGAM
jgi:Cu(I)/Ag(I) efflux system membrane fusion protein